MRKIGTATILCAVLIAVLLAAAGPAAHAEEKPLNLDLRVDSVYVPPGSACNFLGLLFAQLRINGGVELGTLSTGPRKPGDEGSEMVIEMEGAPGEEMVLRSGVDYARPGDPVYMAEFQANKESVRKILADYCGANKQLSWAVRDDVVNIFSSAQPDKEKNPLDFVVKEVRFGQGTSLEECLASMIRLLRDQSKRAKVTLHMSDDGTLARPVLPDHAGEGKRSCLSRPQEFKNMSLRQILNALVRPFHNVVWVARYYQLAEGAMRAHIFFGSWRAAPESGLDDPDYWLAALETKADPKEAKTWLYVCYKRNKEATTKAFKARIEKAKDSETRESLERVLKYLSGDPYRYTRLIVGADY